MGYRLHLELEVAPGHDGQHDVEGYIEALNASAQDGLIVELHLSSDALMSSDDNNEIPTFVKKVGIEETLD